MPNINPEVAKAKNTEFSRQLYTRTPSKEEDMGLSEADWEAMQAEQSQHIDAVENISGQEVANSQAVVDAEKSHYQQHQDRIKAIHEDIDNAPEGSQAWNEACSVLGELKRSYHGRNHQKVNAYFENRAEKEDASLILERKAIADEYIGESELYEGKSPPPKEVKAWVDQEILKRHPDTPKSKTAANDSFGSVCFETDWR